MASDTQEKKIKNATKWAIGFTVVWLSCFFILLFIKRCTISALELNEWGDLIAGTFAPLAFFWLVYGYFQQGEELRLNREALLLQQHELAEQVKATNALVDPAVLQAKIMKEAHQLALLDREIINKPKLKIKKFLNGESRECYEIENLGANIYRVKFSCSYSNNSSLPEISLVTNALVGFHFLDDRTPVETMELYVDYETNDGAKHRLTYVEIHDGTHELRTR